MNTLSSQPQDEQQVETQTQPRIVLPESYIRCYLPEIIENIRTSNRYEFLRAPDAVIFFEALSRLGKAEVLKVAFKAKSATGKIVNKPTNTEPAIKEQILDELFPEWRTICNPAPITN